MKRSGRLAAAAAALLFGMTGSAHADDTAGLELTLLSVSPLLACSQGNEELEAAERAAELSCNPVGRLPYFAQWESPWGNKPLGDLPLCEGDEAREQAEDRDASCCMPYAASACGPTSLAMVLKAYGEHVTPYSIGEMAVKAGLRRCNVDGISPAAIVATGKLRGYVVDDGLDASFEVPKTGLAAEVRLDRLEALLRSGRPVILGCAGCTVKNDKGASRTFPGHFMVLSGVNDDGSFAVLDPSGFDGRSIDRDEVRLHSRLQYIRRVDRTPVVACRR